MSRDSNKDYLVQEASWHDLLLFFSLEGTWLARTVPLLPEPDRHVMLGWAPLLSTNAGKVPTPGYLLIKVVRQPLIYENRANLQFQKAWACSCARRSDSKGVLILFCLFPIVLARLTFPYLQAVARISTFGLSCQRGLSIVPHSNFTRPTSPPALIPGRVLHHQTHHTTLWEKKREQNVSCILPKGSLATHKVCTYNSFQVLATRVQRGCLLSQCRLGKGNETLFTSTTITQKPKSTSTTGTLSHQGTSKPSL